MSFGKGTLSFLLVFVGKLKIKKCLFRLTALVWSFPCYLGVSAPLYEIILAVDNENPLDWLKYPIAAYRSIVNGYGVVSTLFLDYIMIPGMLIQEICSRHFPDEE